MKTFNELTHRGKMLRLRKVVINALEQYDLEVRSVRLQAAVTNTLFRVRTMDGVDWVARVCSPGWRTESDLESEAQWLGFLKNSPEIGSPIPLKTKSGALFTIVQIPGIRIPLRVFMMSWLPGMLLGKRLTESKLWKMGQLFARLHVLSEQFVPGKGFTCRKMNRVLARDETPVLFEENALSSLTPRSREIFRKTVVIVEDTYATRYSDENGLRVIHHDLHQDNINIYKGKLYPFDFEDTVWGFPVQDIAMAMQDLMEVTTPDLYDRLLAAFRSGYEAHLPWPELYPGEMDIFRVGRMLWVANYVACYESEFLVKHLKWLTGKFGAFLETGTIRRTIIKKA